MLCPWNSLDTQLTWDEVLTHSMLANLFEDRREIYVARSVSWYSTYDVFKLECDLIFNRWYLFGVNESLCSRIPELRPGSLKLTYPCPWQKMGIHIHPCFWVVKFSQKVNSTGNCRSCLEGILKGQVVSGCNAHMLWLWDKW